MLLLALISAVCRYCCCCFLVAKSCPTLFATPWTVACQFPLSMRFPTKNAGMSCHFLL